MPLPYGRADRFDRFIANCRNETDKETPVVVLRHPRPERIPQEVELLLGIILFPLVILAVDNPRPLQV
jgi:hypothetical protein